MYSNSVKTVSVSKYNVSARSSKKMVATTRPNKYSNGYGTYPIAVFWIFIFFILLFPKTVSSKPSISASMNIPVLRLTTKTHDRMIIMKEIQQAHEELFSLKSKNHAQMYTGKNEMKCLDETKVLFSIKDVEYITLEHEASECRMNVNQDYLSIYSPTPNIHEMIFRKDDPIKSELEHNIISKFDEKETFENVTFYDFSNLNYNLQCSLGYLDISQIMLQETSVHVTLEKVMSIPETCGFKDLDKDFNGGFTQTVNLDIPLNGSFYCHEGKSKSCKRTIAETSHARYKIIDDEKMY